MHTILRVLATALALLGVNLIAADLTINLTPTSGRWRVDAGSWRASGVTVTGLATGNHTVEYDGLAGYAKPATETVALAGGQALVLARSYTQLAQLSITLTPTTGKWRVDGGGWRASGSTPVTLTPGDHLVEYDGLTGYVKPPAETVALIAGQNLALARSYTPTGQTAQLTVTLTPSNGQWRIDGGIWRASGATVTGLTIGNHTVEYNSVSGYTSPPTETIALAASQSLSISRNYILPTAQLTVTLTPSNGQWRVDGGAWQASGATVTGLIAGDHSVEYSALSGYSAPATESVNLTAGQSLSLSRSYTELPAQLTITLTPSTGQWRIDSGAWQASGATVTGLSAGNHTVEYNSLSGYTAPATESLSLTAGQSLSLSRSYTALPAQLTITLTPATGQWRVDSGVWQASGATVTGLSAGNHTIEYNSLSGYTAPATESVNLAGGQSLSLSRSYTIVPTQLTVTLTPTSAYWRVDGGAWQASGTTVTGLAAGAHSVTYYNVSGYVTPFPETVTLTAGQALSLVREYELFVVAYTVTQLGTLGGTRTVINDLNLAGTAVGSSTTAGGQTHAFRYRNGVMEDLGAPGGLSTTGWSVNDQNVVLGTTAGLTPQARGFLYDSSLVLLDGFTSGEALGINNAGTVVGYSQATGAAHLIRYRNGVMEDLGTASGFSTVGIDVNDAGTIVGMASTTPGAPTFQAVSYSNGAWQYLGTLGGIHSQANAINEAGVIVGYARLSNGRDRPFRHANGIMEDIGTLGGNSAIAYGINNAGTITGRSDTTLGRRAFIYKDGRMRDLNSMVTGVATLTSAVKSNDLGQIAALDDDNHAYLLTPINAPGGLRVDLTPASAQWRVDGGTWQASGTPVLNLAIGSHTVEYNSVAGYTTPAAETVSVASGRLTQIARSYAAIPTAQLTVTLVPSTSQWRVDGGAWQASGVTVTGLAIGNHLVEYAAAADYKGPASETVALSAGQSAQLTRSYTPLLYTVTSMGIGGLYYHDDTNASGARAINLEGAVAGGTYLNGQVVGYIYKDGVVEETGNLGGPGFALGMNDSGAAVGFSLGGVGSPFQRRATRYASGVLLDLDPNGSDSMATAINSSGTVVGGSNQKAFIHTDGAMYDLGKWGGTQASARDINDSEVILGAVLMADNSVVAVRYHDGVVENVPGIGGAFTVPRAISNSGIIVGEGSLSGSAPVHAFRHENGTSQDLGTLGGVKSRALDVNDASIVVGWAEIPGNAPHAFVHREGAMIDLNTVANVPEGVVLTSANGINASGQIIANGSDAIGYILTPITNLGGVSVQVTASLGQWRVDGGAWQNSNAIVSGLAAGSHSIEYSAVINHATPASESVTVNGGRTAVLRRTYVANAAQLTVTLTPSNGQWRVDGGTWQASGTAINELAAGSHTVEYASLGGHASPPTESVTLVNGQQLTLNRDYIPQIGAIDMTLGPVGAQWSLDGGIWRETGLVAGVAPGEHTISYNAIVGYVTPNDETVTVTANQTLTLVRTYAQHGQIKVTLTPSNGKWRFSNEGFFRNSGTTATGLAPGNYTIVYQALAGYQTPSQHTVTLASGQSLEVNRTYPPLTATVKITLTPGTGTWRIDGGPLNNSGATVTGVSPGSHTISYGTLAGYTPPPSEPLTVVAGQSVDLDRAYTQPPQLTVTLSPSSGQWRLDGGIPRASGTTATNLATGNHTVSYVTIPGYAPPNTEIVNLAPGQSRSISRNYTSLTAQLTVTLTPTNGQWRVDGGAWQASGATVAGLAAGNHTVEYNSVTGYTTPANDTVSLVGGQSLSLHRDYGTLPAQLTVTTVPGSGQWRVDGGAWQPSGATITGLIPGSHTVEFNNVPGYLPPYPETFGMSSGQSHSRHYSYTPIAAQLTVTLNPSNAQWRVLGGTWQPSGATIDLGVGDHTIYYAPLAGYNGPLNEKVTLSDGESLALARDYTPVTSPPSYTAVQVPGGWASAMNDSATVVGSTSNPVHAYRYANGVVQDLGTLGGSWSGANGINHLSTVVGSAEVALNTWHAFLFANGPMQDLGTLGGGSSYAMGINDAGVVIGSSEIAPGESHAFRYTNGSMQDLGTLGGASSWAYSINQAGTIVGESDTGSNAPRHAFVFSGGVMEDLSVLGGVPVRAANDINDLGAIVGYAQIGADRAYLYQGGSTQLLGNLGTQPHSAATAINNAGIVVGYALTGGVDDMRPFIYSGGAMTDLNTLVSIPGVLLTEAKDINNQGQILVQGTDFSDVFFYVLTPISPSPTHLTVTLDPTQAQWRVDGGVWQASGATVDGLAVGNHLVEYKSLWDYTSPPSETITLASSQSLSLSRNYGPLPPTQMSLVLSPATGQWRVDSGPWQASGAVVSNLTPGLHTVEYDALPGYSAPATETVALVSAELNEFSRSYAALPTQITISLTPGTGQWRVDGGAWQASGATLGNLAAGVHRIYFRPLTGHNPPTNIYLTLATGQSLALTREYAPVTDVWFVAEEVGALGDPQLGAATDLNFSGSVTGLSRNSAGWYHAYLKSSGIMQDLGTLGGTNSFGVAISDSGVVVGSAATPAGVMHAFVYDGTMVDLQLFGGVSSGAYDINENGVIVGSAHVATNVQHAFSYDPGRPITKELDLGTLGGTNSEARGINSLGVITGAADNAAGQSHAFVFDGAGMRDLGTLGGATSLGNDVSYFGTVVGRADTAGGQTRAFWYDQDQGSMHDLGTLNGDTNSEAFAINTPGIIVGRSYTDLLTGSRPFIQSTGLHDLNSLVNIPGVVLVDATAINDRGQILVHGTDYTRDYDFILTPVTPPSALASVTTFAFPAGIAAQWRLDGGAWQNTGTTLNNLAFDVIHTVEFAPVEGYVAPLPQTFTLGSGELRTVNGFYTPLASVTTFAFPAGITAQWRLDGGAWQNPGTTLNNLAFDVIHTVEFAPVEGYVAPLPQTFTLGSGELRTVNGFYTPLASVTTFAFPAGITAQWRLDGGAWQNPGTTLNNLAFDVIHTVEFAPVEGYVAPLPQTFTLGSGELRTVNGFYMPLASVTVLTFPGGLTAQWRLDGGAWQNPGTTLNNLAFDVSHTVEFSAVEGYTTPSPQSFSLGSGELRTLSATYTALPAQITVTLAPSNGQWRVDGGAWQSSGSTVTDLVSGTHSLEFAPLAGYVKPAGETVTLSAGQQLSLSRSYSAIEYAVTPLGSLGGTTTYAFAINLAGTVAGKATTADGRTHAFRFRDDALQDLGTLGGDESVAFSVNDDDVVVGSARLASGESRAFRFGGGPMESLGTLGGSFSEAYAINNAGVIAGSSTLATGGTAEAFRYENGVMTSMGTLAGFPTLPFDLNEAGVVVGWAALDGSWSASRAFRYEGGTMTGFGTLGGLHSQANSVNEAGVIVGSAALANGSDHAFQSTGGPMLDLGVLGGTTSRAFGINNAGVVVGSTSVDATGLMHAFVFKAGVMRDLNSVVDLPGVVLREALGPTDLGQIAVYASDNRSYLLTPLSGPGGVRVKLSPAMAQWRVDGGAWQASGTPVLTLASGNHLVEYNTIPGYTTPVSETISVSSGRLLQINRSYAVAPAQVTVTLTPATGQWRIDGGVWRVSGSTATGLAAGNHTLEYNTLSGYTAPATETITLAAGQSLSVNRSYTSTQPGSLRINLTPTSGRWRVDAGVWRASGAIVSALAAGNHTVEYDGLAGYTKPPTETITLASGQALVLARSYTQQAQLTITLTPSTGRWRVDGGGWRASGGSSLTIAPGDHLIEYDGLSGYIKPPNETVTLTAGQNLSLARSYTQ